jgi:hypothetical protein
MKDVFYVVRVKLIQSVICYSLDDPCGGGIEYLHRDPASRRRRRKGKSQIWDSKIWSRVPRDSDPRETALARTSKRQTHPLARKSAPQKRDRNCQGVIKIWSWAPDWARHQDLLTDWPLVAMWLWRYVRRYWETSAVVWSPCGGGVECLHRDPASRRRRRKGKSQIWNSKIRAQVPRD